MHATNKTWLLTLAVDTVLSQLSTAPNQIRHQNYPEGVALFWHHSSTFKSVVGAIFNGTVWISHVSKCKLTFNSGGKQKLVNVVGQCGYNAVRLDDSKGKQKAQNRHKCALADGKADWSGTHVVAHPILSFFDFPVFLMRRLWYYQRVDGSEETGVLSWTA